MNQNVPGRHLALQRSKKLLPQRDEIKKQVNVKTQVNLL